MNDWTKTARELRFVTGNSGFLLDDMPDMLRSLNARDLGRLKRGLAVWTPESWLSARERVPLELGLKIRRFAGGKRGREVLIQLRNDLVVAYGPLHEMWLGKSTEFMRQWRRANNLPRKLHQPKQERYEWDDEPEAL